jgi:hypothetical protein
MSWIKFHRPASRKTFVPTEWHALTRADIYSTRLTITSITAGEDTPGISTIALSLSYHFPGSAENTIGAFNAAAAARRRPYSFFQGLLLSHDPLFAPRPSCRRRHR